MELTNEIQAKLQEVIDANLPQQMGASFKKYFDESTRIKAELEQEKAKAKSLTEDRSSLQRQIDEYSKKQADFNAIVAREKAVETREKAMEIHDLKQQLLCSEKTKDMMHNLVSGLTRNTTFRETIFKNDNVMVEYHGNDHVPVNRGSSTTITKEID